MSELSEQLGEVAKDLFAIEVNTIFKSNMTATRMPNIAHTLLDIASDYYQVLLRLGTQPRKDDGAPNPNIYLEFNDLRSRANVCMKSNTKESQTEQMLTQIEIDYLLLCRIKDNCDQIKGTLDALRKRVGTLPENLDRTTATDMRIELTASERLHLRKIWEVGTETVVMQTVIHLDGDLFTRLQPLTNRSIAEEQRLMTIHNNAIGTAVMYWKTMTELVSSFFQTLVPMLKR